MHYNLVAKVHVEFFGINYTYGKGISIGNICAYIYIYM